MVRREAALVGVIANFTVSIAAQHHDIKHKARRKRLACTSTKSRCLPRSIITRLPVSIHHTNRGDTPR